MIIETTRKGLLKTLKQKQDTGPKLGFVPTMGALHKGHFSLIKAATTDCDLVVVSIFINPTQFDNPADLEKYPNNVKKDIDALQHQFNNLIVFTPSPNEIYDGRLEAKHYDFEGLDRKMEGAFRDGHFDGVGTILEKLFTLIKPQKAYFGEKDYQQLQIVKKLVRILDLPIEIVGCPINREETGLARSSRNKRLNTQEKEKALLLYKSLLQAKQEFGTKNAADIIEEVEAAFKKEVDFKLDYFSIADAETLEPVKTIDNNRKYRAFVAAFLGDVRLIDNIALN